MYSRGSFTRSDLPVQCMTIKRMSQRQKYWTRRGRRRLRCTTTYYSEDRAESETKTHTAQVCACVCGHGVLSIRPAQLIRIQTAISCPHCDIQINPLTQRVNTNSKPNQCASRQLLASRYRNINTAAYPCPKCISNSLQAGSPSLSRIPPIWIWV